MEEEPGHLVVVLGTELVMQLEDVGYKRSVLEFTHILLWKLYEK
jgi:hypothetical protein